MINRPDQIHGISKQIEELIEHGQKINLVLEKGKNTVYERVLTPISVSLATGIILYRHVKNTYDVIKTVDGNVYRLTDKKDMPETSTIGNKIYMLLRTLEQSGYKLMETTNWNIKK